MNKLVSICIPTYNGAQFIAEALESAINQTYPNLEIVVSDDASTDDTLGIIESYISKTLIPIRIIKHKPDGIGANWNNCIRKAQGEYIKFLFQDDILEYQCIEKMVALLNEFPKLGLVASKRYCINEHSKLIDDKDPWMQLYSDLQRTLSFPEHDDLMVVTKELLKSPAFFEEPINKIGEPTAVLFRARLVDEIGCFRKDLNQMLDFEFYYRLLRHYKIGILSTKLVRFRIHEKQTTNLNVKKGIIKNDLLLYNKIIYKDFFWYVNNAKKWELLKAYHPIVKLFKSSY